MNLSIIDYSYFEQISVNTIESILLIPPFNLPCNFNKSGITYIAYNL